MNNGEYNKKNHGDKLPGDINNKRGKEHMFVDQVPTFDITTPDNLYPHQRYMADAYPRDKFSENLTFPNGTSNEKINDIYLKDEESMIPKGLLDLMSDEGEEVETNSGYESNNQQYSIPCFIAFLPPGNNERYQAHFGQYNGMYSCNAPQNILPLSSIPTYVRPQTNEYYNQYQRNIRNINITQPRSHQSVEFSCWNSVRPCPNLYSGNSNLDLRMFNNQRSTTNLLHGYETYQEFACGRYPFGNMQEDINYNTHLNYGFLSSYGNHDSFQVPYSKTFIKKINKGKESEINDNSTHFDETLPNPNNIDTSNLSSDDCNVSQADSTASQTDQECGLNSMNAQNLTIEDNSEMESFHQTALYRCLQLEEILSSNKIVSEVDLKECCVRMKNELSKLKYLSPPDSILKELIFAFLHICNTWVSLNLFKSAKHDQSYKNVNFKLLVDAFQAWETKSKILLDNLIVYIYTLTSHKLNKNLFINNLVKSVKEPYQLQSRSNLEQFQNTGEMHIKKEIPLFNGNHGQCTTKEICKNNERNIEQLECTLGQLSPETYTQTKPCDSSFIYDNLMKELKKNQEKNNSNIVDKNKFSCHNLTVKQNASSRGKFPLTVKNGESSKVNSKDKSFVDFQISKLPLLDEMDFLQKNEAIDNLSKISNDIKSPEEEKSLEQKYVVDKFVTKIQDKNTPLQKSEAIIKEGHTKPFSSRKGSVNKHNLFVNTEVIEKIHDNDFLGTKKIESNFLSNETKGNNISKRYSLRHKRRNKNVNISKNDNKPDDDDSIDQAQYIKNEIKLKMYNVLLGIQSINLKTIISQKIVESDIIKTRHCLINPLMNVSQSLSRNWYRSMNDVIDDVYKCFYRAKCENKGNITILTIVNRLELRLMNSMFEEIGFC